MKNKYSRFIFGVLITIIIVTALTILNLGFVSLSKSTEEAPELTIEETQIFENKMVDFEPCIENIEITFDRELMLYSINYYMDSTCDVSYNQYYNIVLESVAALSKITNPEDELPENNFGRVFDIYNFSFFFYDNGKPVYEAHVNKGEHYIAY